MTEGTMPAAQPPRSRDSAGSDPTGGCEADRDAAGPATAASDRGPEGLLLRHREGDDQAFSELVLEYRSPVYSYLSRCGIPSKDRDDLFQDIFLKIHRAASGFRTGWALHPWLFTIVANTVRNYFRRQRVRQLVFSRSEAPEACDPAPDGPRVAEARQTAAWLEAEIALLPVTQRQVLLLVSVEGLTLQQTAKAMRVPLNTVKSRLRRARLALARARCARDSRDSDGGTGGDFDGRNRDGRRDQRAQKSEKA